MTLFALCRPLIAAVVILPFVAPGWNASGHGLWLEVAALVLGIVVGLVTAAFMTVTVDASGKAWTDAGYPYAAAWIVFTAARLIFVCDCQHWRPVSGGSPANTRRRACRIASWVTFR